MVARGSVDLLYVPYVPLYTLCVYYVPPMCSMSHTCPCTPLCAQYVYLYVPRVSPNTPPHAPMHPYVPLHALYVSPFTTTCPLHTLCAPKFPYAFLHTLYTPLCVFCMHPYMLLCT